MGADTRPQESEGSPMQQAADQPTSATPSDELSDGAAPLKQTERTQVEERIAPPAAVVYESIRREGESELKRSTSALAWSGLAAGLSMGFSLVAEGLLRVSLPDTSWRSLIARLGYSVGFLIVVLGRQQLFTENTLTPILPLLARRDRATLLQVARLWGVVLLANLVGACLFAWIIGSTNLFERDIQQTFADIGREVLVSDFWATLLRGVFAGWLIALMVWLLPFAETARVSVIIIITYLVGIGKFAHVVAGSTKVFYLVVIGAASWSTFLGGFLVPTLIGNILGGVALVAIINHAQVFAGGDEGA
jgi:formate/nitrite transporter FocA (FNT family)